MSTLELVPLLQARTAAVIEANPQISPAYRSRITGKPSRPIVPPVKEPKPMPVVHLVPRVPPPPPLVEKIADRKVPIEIAKLVHAVAKAFDIPAECVMSVRRLRTHSWPRFALIKLIRDRKKWSTTRIGNTIGRDHTSIMWALIRATELHDNDPHWRLRYDAALAEVTAGEP